MGIRKHFEQGPSNEDLKLQDLSLEQDKEIFFIDLDTELTDQDWENIDQHLTDLRVKKKWIPFIDSACMTKFITPPDKDFQLDLDESELKELEENITEELEREDYDVFFGLSMAFPELIERFQLREKFGDKIWESYRHEFSEAINASATNPKLWSDVARVTIKIKASFPEKFKSLELPPDLFENIKKHAQQALQDKDILNLKEELISIKILFPSQGTDLFRNQQIWKLLNADFQETKKDKKENMYALIGDCVGLKILLAERVEFTRNGLNTVGKIQQDFKSEKKPRPERKNF